MGEETKKTRKPVRVCRRCKKRLNQKIGDGYFFCKQCFKLVNKLQTDLDE